VLLDIGGGEFSVCSFAFFNIFKVIKTKKLNQKPTQFSFPGHMSEMSKRGFNFGDGVLESECAQGRSV
jgi:hypothetical protein